MEVPTSLDELFQHAIVVSCDLKKQALQKAAFKYAGLPYPKVLDAVTPDVLAGKKQCKLLDELCAATGVQLSSLFSHCSQPERGCATSHLLAVWQAIQNGWPWILVFEDDAWPRKDASTALLQSVPDMFSAAERDEVGTVAVGHIGYTSNAVYNEKATFIEGITRLSGSHAYIMFKNAYMDFANAQLSPSCALADIALNKSSRLKILRQNLFIQYMHSKWKTTPNITYGVDRGQLYTVPDVPAKSSWVGSNVHFFYWHSDNDMTKDYVCYEDVQRAMAVDSALESLKAKYSKQF